MPILNNQRHELFAQEIAKGKSASKAYETVGYRPSRKNASRLRAREDVNARVLELQHASAQSAVITVQTICRELDAAVEVARSKGQAQAMVSASSLRAKLAGLLTDRVEITNLDHYKRLETPEQISAAMARDLAGVDLTPEQLTEFTKIVNGWYSDMQEYLAACAAKPVETLPAKPQIEIERRRLGLPKQ